MKNNFKMQICNSIKSLRLKSKLPQDKFAEKCNIAYDSLRKWETGKNVPSAENINKICDSFNLTVVELLLLDKSTNETDKQAKIKSVSDKLTSLTPKQIDFIEEVVMSLIAHS